MADNFSYDVFLSHSSKDKAVVRPIAERLKRDGLKVWFDDWSIKVGDNIPQKIEEGLENSRVLLLCMSANAFGSDWAQLESQTFRFRDPLNKERRFIPLRLDDAPIKGSLAQFSYIRWISKGRKKEYAKLLEACRPPAKARVTEAQAAGEQVAERAIELEYYHADIQAYEFSPDGARALSNGTGETVRVWDLQTGRCLQVLKGHTARVDGISWSVDQRHALSGGRDNMARLWDVEAGICLHVLEGHTKPVWSVALSSDRRRGLSGSNDHNVRLWDLETGRCLRVLEGHTGGVLTVAWSGDSHRGLSGATDRTIRLWDLETGECLRVFQDHAYSVVNVAYSSDQNLLASGSDDCTVRVWDLAEGRCLSVLEGHTNTVARVAWSPDQRHILSGSLDQTLRLWDVETGLCLCVLKGHVGRISGVGWSADGSQAFSGDRIGGVMVWDLSKFLSKAKPARVRALEQIQYTNAKVLLVGESGAGKTGLSKVLAGEKWQPSDSTVGAWATQWKLPVVSGKSGGDRVEREIWLWDFGGQADQRLIHQLYMDETALAVLVFDGQKEDLFETLGQWDRDLMRASSKEFAKLLVAGRVDAGGLRVSRSQVEAFANDEEF